MKNIVVLFSILSLFLVLNAKKLEALPAVEYSFKVGSGHYQISFVEENRNKEVLHHFYLAVPRATADETFREVSYLFRKDNFELILDTKLLESEFSTKLSDRNFVEKLSFNLSGKLLTGNSPSPESRWLIYEDGGYRIFLRIREVTM
jgi:hypothetical protein